MPLAVGEQLPVAVEFFGESVEVDAGRPDAAGLPAADLALLDAEALRERDLGEVDLEAAGGCVRRCRVG
jgi:hypothetical protein